MEKINKFFGYEFSKEKIKTKNLRKLPSVIENIQKHIPKERIEGEKTVSFSQIQMYNECPKKWELQYKKKLYKSAPSINMTFGTAIHETIQFYLNSFYNNSIVKTDEINLEDYFQERFTENYKKEYENNNKIHFSSEEEMHEFYDDGIKILEYIKKKKGEYFSKRHWYLVGCEIPLILEANKDWKNIIYKGYIDIVLYHEPTNKFIIIDIKTSTRGWSKNEQKDEIKQAQLLLYKQLFNRQFNIPLENIEIEFFILRRKLWEKSKWPQKRIQTFTPLHGETKINNAYSLFLRFLDECFTKEGEYKERDFSPKPSSKCKWCPFNNNEELCDKKVL